MEIKDEILVNQIKKNDQRSLELLFERYYYPLCHFARNFINNTGLSEEIVSDVFLNIWLKRNTLDIETSIKAYLFTAVKNQAINYIKKNRIILEELEILDKQGEVSENSADWEICYTEVKQTVEGIIEELPRQRQIIFRLNKIDGLKYKEIAELLSISINTVQKQMTEAIKYIARHKLQFKSIFTDLFSL